MKRMLYVTLVLGLLALFSLTGCGSSDNTEEIKAAADGFMSAMEAGDLQGMKEYADPALFEEDGALYSFARLENITQEFATALGVEESSLGEKAKADMQEFVDILLKNMVSSYEIGDVTESEGKGSVNVKTTFGFDPEKMEDIDINDELEKMATDYMTDNMESLMEIYNKDGQQAMMNKVVDDLMGDILKKYTDAVMATGEVTQNSVITVENKDDKWIVTDETEAE